MYDSTLANHQVNVVGNLFQHSTRLNNELSRKFIFGGTINDELSQKVYENQSDYNRVGFGGHIGIEYRAPNQIFKSKPNWSWMVRSEERRVGKECGCRWAPHQSRKNGKVLWVGQGRQRR